MSDWETQFAAMRLQFFERARARVEQMPALVLSLNAATTDVDALLALRKEFHWLAGVGGTYKLPELSAFGYEGERIIDLIMDDRRGPTDEEIAGLDSIILNTKSVLQNLSP